MIGSFTDRDLTSGAEGNAAESSRLDLLTGLLNSGGLAEEGHVFRDEYFRRKVDFIRILVAIDDVAAINRQYGFDHSDKMIAALGKALQNMFGTAAVPGSPRFSGCMITFRSLLRYIKRKPIRKTAAYAVLNTFI